MQSVSNLRANFFSERDGTYTRAGFLAKGIQPGAVELQTWPCWVYCTSARWEKHTSGCVNIDERVVISRTLRTHPSHQPFNQVGTAPEIVPNTDVWYDPSCQLHPMEQAARSDQLDEAAVALPRYACVLTRRGGQALSRTMFTNSTSLWK